LLIQYTHLFFLSFPGFLLDFLEEDLLGHPSRFDYRREGVSKIYIKY
jgi:hypothetical protein